MARLKALIESACAGLGAEVQADADPGRDAAQPVRRRADRGGAQGRDPGRAHADREGPGLHAAPPRACCCTPSARKCSARRCRRREWRSATPSTSRSFIKKGVDGRAAGRAAAAVRPEPASARRSSPSATCSSTTSACRPCTTATSCTCSEAAHRAAAGLLHARRDGPGAERDRPRSARDRVLRGAVELRLHVEHADAVQLRHAALAAVELLPDHRRRRPRRHLRGDQGKRAAVEVRRRPGQRLDAGARARLPHQGHQRQIAGRGAVPQSGQRHRGGGEPGRQAQGRGLRLPRNLAPRHRGIPRAAQEHRRRPPPHARHEHRELDSRPVHEARDGRAATGRCSRRPTCPDLHDKFGRDFETRLHRLRSEGRARRDHAVQARPRDATCGARCCRCCSRPGIRGSRSRTPATCARRSSTSASCTARTCAPRSRSTPATNEIAVCNLGSVNLRAAPDRTASSTTPSCKRTVAHRDAHARQRDRHQLLRGQEGARLEPAPPPGRPGHHGLPGLPVPAAHAVRARRRRSSSPTARWRPSATTPTGPRPSWPRSAAATRASSGSLWDRGILPHRHARAAGRGARRLRRGRPLDHARLGRAARSASRPTACATRTASRSRRRRRSPTSSASIASIEPTLPEPVGEDRTCRASSPWSTSTWCAT